MATETIEFLVDAGKATAGPPLGPKLGPIGVNIGQVVSAINKETQEMKGMQVPIKLIVNKDDKSFEITVGTPPTSALIKKELNLQKGSGKTGSEMVADIPIDNLIKVARIKSSSLLASDMIAAVKEVIGTCQSTGVEVEGMMPRDAIRAINEGKWQGKILGKEKLEEHTAAELEEKKKKLAVEIEAHRAEEAAEEAAEKAAEEAREAPAEEEEIIVKEEGKEVEEPSEE